VGDVAMWGNSGYVGNVAMWGNSGYVGNVAIWVAVWVVV